MKIFKYPLGAVTTQKVLLPINSEILTAQAQGLNLCLWALVEDHNTDKEDRIIQVFGTGHDIPEGNRKYIGTTQMQGGALVWHIFELLP